MSINTRTVFYDNTNNVVRFWDWALVNTTLGTMAEPFIPNDRHSMDYDLGQFDPTDEIARIDTLQQASIDTHMQTLSGGVDALNGGHQMPRDGR